MPAGRRPRGSARRRTPACARPLRSRHGLGPPPGVACRTPRSRPDADRHVHAARSPELKNTTSGTPAIGSSAHHLAGVGVDLHEHRRRRRRSRAAGARRRCPDRAVPRAPSPRPAGSASGPRTHHDDPRRIRDVHVEGVGAGVEAQRVRPATATSAMRRRAPTSTTDTVQRARHRRSPICAASNRRRPGS